MLCSELYSNIFKCTLCRQASITRKVQKLFDGKLSTSLVKRSALKFYMCRENCHGGGQNCASQSSQGLQNYTGNFKLCELEKIKHGILPQKGTKENQNLALCSNVITSRTPNTSRVVPISEVLVQRVQISYIKKEHTSFVRIRGSGKFFRLFDIKIKIN